MYKVRNLKLRLDRVTPRVALTLSGLAPRLIYKDSARLGMGIPVRTGIGRVGTPTTAAGPETDFR